jgi:Na+/proline symporter
VCTYVILGGLRATFLCDYSHGLVLMVIILYFMFTVYTSNETIGSPSRMYDLLHEAAIKRPVAGNHEGSYLTLKSNLALIFGVIQLCSGSGTVFLDQAYFQRAVASRPTTAVKAYVMGGLAWFAIPFGFATTLGLAAVALADHPQFPTYPNLPSESDISAGLASALSASALLGTHGAVALLLSLFLAVTSCASAELIAVSSVLTFDIYKAYFNPSASPSRLITVSKICICIFGLTMSIFAVIWNLIGIDLGWLFLVMGLIIGGAVFPMAFSITWTGQSKAGAIAGPISGLCAGIIAWLVTAQQYFGELTIASTGHEYSTLAGNMAAIFTGLIVTVVVSLCKPQNFDWAITRAINSPPVTDLAVTPPEESQETSMDMKRDESPAAAAVVNSDEKPKGEIHAHTTSAPPAESSKKQEQDMEEANADADLEEHPTKLRRALMVAYVAAITLTLIMDFLVSLLVRFLHPDIPTNSRLSTDPNPNVPLALRLLAGLLYRLDRHIVHLGLRFDIY